MYDEMTAGGTLAQKIEEQRKVIDFANRKKSKLLQLVADESVTHADFKSMTASCNEEIAEAEKKIAELEALVSESETFRVKIESIRKVMADAQRDAARGLIDKEFVETYIGKIFVTPVDESTMRLTVKIFTEESTEKLLRKLEFHGGIMNREEARNEETPSNGSKSPLSSPVCVDASAGHTFKKMVEKYENEISTK
jgi:chromosome segregation ATPase